MPSRVHQRIFAAADVVLAGRYHPAVFSVLGAVPVACIAYEHKSVGLMEAAGLGHLVMPIDTVTAESLIGLLDKVVDSALAIREQLRTVRPMLRERGCTPPISPSPRWVSTPERGGVCEARKSSLTHAPKMTVTSRDGTSRAGER